MTVEFTAHFRFPIPDFNTEPWHDEIETFVRAVDTAIYDALLVQDVGNWANSTVYAVGAIVIDSATGLMWTCAIANTSSASPTTFAQERVAHPTFWNATANIPQQRGAWTTATAYIPGDFVVDTNRYAVCIVAHTSGVFNTDLVAARWVVLIDLSSLGVGLNATAEDTIASASSTNIGSKAASRINVTGTTQIDDFGVVANTYKILRFSGALTLKNNANIILFGADIVTAAGDVMFVSSNAVGVWRAYFYTRASGVPLGQPDASEIVKGIAELATQAETNAGADDFRIVTPLKLVTYVTTQINTAVTAILGGVGPTLDTLGEIAAALGLLAPIANPTFTGTQTLPNASVTNLAVSGSLTLPASAVELLDLEPRARAFETQHYHIRDERNNGVDGDALTNDTWNTRTLNTEKTDDLTITTSSNQITLPAGTYRFDVDAVSNFSLVANGATTRNASKLRLRNITDGTTVLVGMSQNWLVRSDTSTDTIDVCICTTLCGTITIAGTKAFEIQNWIHANGGSITLKGGKALSGAHGENEVYLDARIWKIG